MSISILSRIRIRILQPKPDSTISTSLLHTTTVSSDPLITSTVTTLTHHRSKSRWSTLLRSLTPTTLTPHQFSEITLLLRNNPHLSLNFFLFTRRHSLCPHDTHSFSTLIHVLARSRLKSHARHVIRLALRLDTVSNVFRSLIRNYNRCGSAPFVFDLLLKSCLDSKDIDGALMIIRKLKSKGVYLHISTYNALISEVSRRRGGLDGYKVYREVFCLDNDEAKKVKPNVNTFNMMMVSFCREGEVENVERIWRDMESLGCVANVYSYCVLMEAYCGRGMMFEAEKVWGEMELRDVVAYNTMIGGFCGNLEVKRAKEIFEEMGRKGIECSGLTYEHLVNGYCKVGDVNSAMGVYREMRRKGFEAESLTIEALVEGLCEDRVVEAADIVKDAVSFYPSRECYELLIKRLCEEGKMERALKIQAEMVGKGFKPSEETYKAFIEGYGTVGDEETSALLAIEMAESLKLQGDDEQEES